MLRFAKNLVRAAYRRTKRNYGVDAVFPAKVDRYGSALQGRRLNLVIPALSQKKTFGGVATALRLFHQLLPDFELGRIIVLDESRAQFEPVHWPGWSLDAEPAASRSIAYLGDRKTALRIAEGDFFMATYWTTAVFVERVVSQQSALFALAGRRYLYLIQDYEPSFYPWSARYAYAESTYCRGQNVIAVFNTRLLAEYFSRIGRSFSETFTFEPALNPRLRQLKDQASAPVKERLILVYGRPSEPRNAFDTIVDALRHWVAAYPSASAWSVVSVGEKHADLKLGRGVILRSKGKLTLEAYADQLSRSWIGLSLMISPHPSYPPLEMAEFGCWVITNNFANKNLADLAPSIIGVSDITPGTIAEKITGCCECFESDKTSALDGQAAVFNQSGAEFSFARELTGSWLGSENGGRGRGG